MPKRKEPQGNWISDQRYAKRCLDEGKPCRVKITAERVEILESIPWWVWNVNEAAWESKFQELKEYSDEYGETPPRSHPTLGHYVDNQRMAYRAMQAREIRL